MSVKFILNTAVDPHFCALFSDEGERVDYHEWENRRRDGAELWGFLNGKDTSKFNFIGGVSGPGGFSSLRAGAGVLNSLAFALGIPVHAVRADKWMLGMLGEQFGGEKIGVVLNSFGDGVWVERNGELERYSINEVNSRVDGRVCVSWLPEEKKGVFDSGVELDMKDSPEILLRVLSRVEGYRQFAAEYEVPPVG